MWSLSWAAMWQEAEDAQKENSKMIKAIENKFTRKRKRITVTYFKKGSANTKGWPYQQYSHMC